MEPSSRFRTREEPGRDTGTLQCTKVIVLSLSSTDKVRGTLRPKILKYTPNILQDHPSPDPRGREGDVVAPIGTSGVLKARDLRQRRGCVLLLYSLDPSAHPTERPLEQ